MKEKKMKKIMMELVFEVPFDDEVESLEDVCNEITDATGLAWTWANLNDHDSNKIRFTGTREQIMMFLGQYDVDACADDQL
jgi:hypothetical protein